MSDTELSAQQIAEAHVMRLPELVNANADLLRRAAWFRCDWLIGVGGAEFHVVSQPSRLERVERGPFFMRAWSFALVAPAEAWLAHWEAVPSPGAHDILAMSKRGDLKILGDLHPLMCNLQVVKDIVAAPRGQLEAATS